MTTRHVRPKLTAFGSMMSRPWAFAVVPLYGASWIVFERETFDWHAVATLATWMMTLFIQRAEHRDTQAIHAKLDELLHAEGRARSSLTRIDDVEPEEIEREREDARRGDPPVASA
jgi:low affinity Fe/Cu permease